MKHTYRISGMSCDSCRTKVEKALDEISGITKATISLPDNAIVEMKTHIATEIMQEALTKVGNYTIAVAHQMDMVSEKKETSSCCGGDDSSKKEEKSSCCGGGSHENHKHEHHHKAVPKAEGNSTYYCPMHCEGEKTYNKPGDCPVCGMHLIEQPKVESGQQFTCPMHPDVIKNEPGSCPICGMNLIPLAPSESEEQKVYKELVKKMIIATVFSLPVFIIAMGDLLDDNPFVKIMSLQSWGWVQLVLTIPVVFYACWMFFVRAWKSIITWNLNMFTLVGIGTGVAFLFSVVGMFFPDMFPDEFKTES